MGQSLKILFVEKLINLSNNVVFIHEKQKEKFSFYLRLIRKETMKQINDVVETLC